MAVLVLGLVLPCAIVQADAFAQALVAPATSASLTRKALDCLDRGEDAATKEARLAAYREGLAYAERAVEEDDKDADAHFAVFANRGRIMLIEGAVANPWNLYVVNRELKRTLELNPNHPDALAAKGSMLRQIPRVFGGDPQEAINLYKRSIALDPNAVGARMELAEIYADLGTPELGIPYLEKAAEVARHERKLGRLAEIESRLQALRAPKSASAEGR